MTSEFSSSSITNIAPALLKVQQALKPITKDAENPFLKNRYTSLSSVLETIRPILTENGLVLIQRGITGTPDMLSVESRLIHAPSGEWIRGVISMPMPLVRIENDEPTDESLRKKGRGMNTFQLYGSGLSYGKRYGLMSLLAISTTDEDTDGEFCLPEQTAHPPSRVQERQAPASDITHHSAYLPTINGVSYQKTQDSSGRWIILANGRTLENKDALKNYGFRWDSTSRSWWKSAS